MEKIFYLGVERVKQLRDWVKSCISITEIKVNGSKVSPIDKVVDINVPTDNASLENGAGYTTETKVNELLTAKLAGIRSIEYEVVQSLPQSGEIGKFYLIKTSESDAGDDIYDEYIYVNDRFEKIGTKAMDLSGYLQESEVEEMSQETLEGILQE